MSETQDIGAQQSLKGRCLCGSVQFTATPQSRDMNACHCVMCRRWSAGPFLAVDCGDTVRYDSDDGLTFYPSSEWGERGFCRNCGTSLIWKMQGRPECHVSTQAFDDAGAFTLTSEIFVDEKPDGYAFAGDIEKMTGAEVIAAFMKEQEGA
ncbi:MAG: aldehyde-activating protein [Rhizobiaceae bacterium MnEN-MB40S]|nr:MAG: aldehyde-activating protein [Rhizobiaceae bacterium MnEN-MB40S]